MNQTHLPPVVARCLPERLLNAISHLPVVQIEELRLYAGRCAFITSESKNVSTGVILGSGEIFDILTRMCQGSLYRYEESIKEGYLTLSGGIRVGVGGYAATRGGQITGISRVRSLILRLPHETEVSVHPITERLTKDGSMLVYAPPGVGKSTLLRAAAKELASPPFSRRTVVIDTREELQAGLSDPDLNLTVLSGYPRATGIEIAVRSLGAEIILCDEIGSRRDADAILNAANCGVPLLATAHAKSLAELLSRPYLAELHTTGVFSLYAALSRDAGNGFSYTFSTRATAEKERGHK